MTKMTITELQRDSRRFVFTRPIEIQCRLVECKDEGVMIEFYLMLPDKTRSFIDGCGYTAHEAMEDLAKSFAMEFDRKIGSDYPAWESVTVVMSDIVQPTSSRPDLNTKQERAMTDQTTDQTTDTRDTMLVALKGVVAALSRRATYPADVAAAIAYAKMGIEAAEPKQKDVAGLRERYLAFKAQYDVHIVFVRDGDNYLTFDADAVLVRSVTGILPSRQGDVEFNEVECSRFEWCLRRIIQAGYCAAVCDPAS